jgi:hypothetical protein
LNSKYSRRSAYIIPTIKGSRKLGLAPFGKLLSHGKACLKRLSQYFLNNSGPPAIRGKRKMPFGNNQRQSSMPNNMISRLPKFEKGVDENKNPFCIVLLYLVETPGCPNVRGTERNA